MKIYKKVKLDCKKQKLIQNQHKDSLNNANKKER